MGVSAMVLVMPGEAAAKGPSLFKALGLELHAPQRAAVCLEIDF